MALNKLYYVYGIDTACLYNDEENLLERRIFKARHIKSLVEKRYKNCEKLQQTYNEKGIAIPENLTLEHWKIHYEPKMAYAKETIKTTKPMLQKMLHDNLDMVRTVREEKLYRKQLNEEGQPERSLSKRVAIFDSDLTRKFGLKERQFNTEIVIVKVYYFDVAKSIVKNGFYMEGQKYVFFSSSAGQIRTKKMVAVREDLLKQNWNALTAGLTIDSINAQGGMNINKYLAYLALCNSATDLWEGFNIDRSIVVEDFETEIQGAVDYIDRDTYQITRKVMGVPVTHTDGCGMMLPCVSDRNFMVRLPWVKGLLGVFDFVKFIEKNNGNPEIIDIYGDKHNIIDEDIQIIFTKSQFKMWKFFKNWEEYKENFKKYGCSAGKCNIEEDYFPDATINYQMIQTLTDLTDDELKEIASRSANTIRRLSTDKDTMLKAFGAVEDNPNKNGFQKSLLIYPELLSDAYCRKCIREIKNSKEKALWSAKMDINGKYTFLLPDFYAFCEHLFLGIEVPKGLLKNGEVACNLYKNKKLDCLRSPHLYIEHCVRNNIANEEIKEWFVTRAIYTSTYDLISKVLMFDVDGDKSLVVADKTIVETAERNSKDVVPLFYEMAKAGAKEVNNDNIYEGLELAYTGGNIGEISNAISKIWNSDEITDDKIKAVKLLVMNNNFVIDYAKTLFKPVPPQDIKDMINGFTSGKLPYFFKYAKDKKDRQIIDANNSTVNRLEKLYPKRKLSYRFKGTVVGKLDYRVLMKNPDIKVDKKVIETFRKLSTKLNYKSIDNINERFEYEALFDDVRNKMLSMGYSVDDIVDMLVKEMFYNHHSEKKVTFWHVFGDTVYEHIKEKDVDNFSICRKCGKRFSLTRKDQLYCCDCRNHRKNNRKIIICIDCGKSVMVKGSNKTTCRCENCQKQFRLTQYREYNKKRK